VPDRLAALYPLSTPAWTQWQRHEKADFSGPWRVVGHRPGKGDYEGRMSVTRSAADEYAFSLEVRYADGTKASGNGSAIVYTGYEWRGPQPEMERVAGVGAFEDGKELSGRSFSSTATRSA
jgi:quinohemoprotein amine dehydrogenase